MGLGLYVCLAWFTLVLASLAIAGLHLARRRFEGVAASLAAVMGALLCFGFVSAYIGVCERSGYAGSRPFMVSVALGIAGLVLFALSCLQLRGSSRVRKERRTQ